MLILGIDTCCMAATAALLDDTRLIAQTVINNKKTHSQKMMPMIEQMFDMAEIDISEVDCFAVAAGPGSFTGVRIGVAAAKAMAQACGKPVVGVSTLEALANNNSLFGGIICPILDARREQVYNSLFEGGGLKRLCGDRALGIDRLLAELLEYDKKILFCGDGVSVYAEAVKNALGDRAVFASRMQNMNLGASVAEIGWREFEKGNAVSCGELVPQYVRLSQAERERLEAAGNKGE